MEFESICGNGIIEILSEDKKLDALTVIMKQYSNQEIFTFDENVVKAVEILKITVNEITAKRLKHEAP